jgi:hypothetical protein
MNSLMKRIARDAQGGRSASGEELRVRLKSEVPKRNMIESSPINHATPLLLEVASLV